jgi:hypothetical protein
MECNKVQERLSEYMDGLASADERSLIEEHLHSCHRCSGHLADLKRTIGHVHELEDIEPPAWLTQKVMMKIKAEPGHGKGILKRFFYPLHVKLPIEIAAAVAIALTTLYIFKAVPPEMKLAEAPSERVMPAVLEEKKQSQQEVKGRELSGKKTGTSAVTEDKFVPAEPADQPVLKKKAETIERYAAAPETPAPVLKDEKAAPQSGRMKQEAAPASPAFKSFEERRRDVVSLTVNVRNSRIAGKEIGTAIVQLGGKIIRTDSVDGRNVILAELYYKRIRELSQRMEMFGEIKEDTAIFEGMAGNARIRIEVVEKSE